MKILQIATLVPYPVTDGGKLSVFGLIKSLSEKGHEIDFVCYRKHDDYNSSFKALKEYCNPHILDVQTDNSIIGAAKNLFSHIPYNASKYYSDILLNYIVKLLAEKRFDIIQINHSYLGWLANHLKKITDTPLVMRPQNFETTIMKRYSEQINNPLLKFYSWLQYRKLVSYEPRIYDNFDLCIMMSPDDLKLLRKSNQEINAVVIPAGIEESLLKVEKKKSIPFSIAHIGHTDWFPNYDSLKWFLDEIFPVVVKEEPRAKLYVYGGGSTHKFPVPDKLKSNVDVIGFVPNIWKELEDKSLAVVPLRIGGGIRLKILEMLAIGQPIITTSIGKEGIGVNDNEHLLVADSKEEFISKILKFFNNEYNSEKISDTGRKFIEMNYLWKSIGKRFEMVYNNLIER